MVTAIGPGLDFTWENVAPGVRVVARHRVDPIPTGSRVTLSLEYFGLLGGVLARLTRGITERYLGLEANGLKARCERTAA
jgi:hypothetical protein